MADDPLVTITVRRSVLDDALACVADVRDGDDPDEAYRAYYGAAHEELSGALREAVEADRA